MKVKTKDEIIFCLIELLQFPHLYPSDLSDEEKDYYINKGWIEALKWILNITSEQKDVDTKS